MADLHLALVDMVDVPAGPFGLGEGEDKHSLHLGTFKIARYPITSDAYLKFVQDSPYPSPPHWRNGRPPQMLADHPVVNISWFDALAFCRWFSSVTGYHFRLPTEAEWEKAARGEAGNIYPWGNTFDANLCNTWEGGFGRTMPVDYFPEGASVYGVLDLAGNVWEWCSSRQFDYPYHPEDGREDLTTEDWRILRGGSWYDTDWGVRASRRLASPPDYISHNTGFRVACDHNN